MFEIIPNWHPLVVHFSIALLSMSTMFFVALNFTRSSSIYGQLKIMAYWNLWIGTGFAIITAIAGWFAYNSVAHDTASHIAMTDHRNWALITLSVFIIVSWWSIVLYKNEKEINMAFTFTILMAFVLLASTGWRGSEVVYRYGLGVMSLPKVEGEGHAHEHADGAGHSSIDITSKNKQTESKVHMHEESHSDSLTSEEVTNKKAEHDHTGHKH